MDTRSLIEILGRHGTAVLPSIKEKLGKGGERFNMLLVRSISAIKGDDDEVASLLLSQLVDNPYPGARGEAMFRLGMGNRTIRRPLSQAELAELKAIMNGPNFFGPGWTSGILSRCVQVPLEQRVSPIVERYEKEVISPTKIPPIQPKPLVSDRVFLLNQYLLAIGNIGSPAIPRLSKASEDAAGNQELKKWLTIALGYAGDQAVSNELKDLLIIESDTSTKSVLIRAYAKAAKQDGLQFLRNIVDDERMKDVQWVIKEEIYKLEKVPTTPD